MLKSKDRSFEQIVDEYLIGSRFKILKACVAFHNSPHNPVNIRNECIPVRT